MSVKVKIGDPVEVKYTCYDPKRGRRIVEQWRPATVMETKDSYITVCFSDHTHMAVERGRHHFRKVK